MKKSGGFATKLSYTKHM